jgi:hypothetical protein
MESEYQRKGVFMMNRKFIFSVVVVLLLSSGAFACIGCPGGFSVIGQAEGFSMDASNVIGRFGGVGSAEGGNMVMVGHAQEAHDIAGGTAALQEETAILTQSASSAGMGGASGVVEEAIINGSQGQNIGPGMRAEGQSLEVGLNTITSQAGSIGSAVGAQGLVAAQNQMEITPNGISAGSQFVGAAQFSAVSGGPWSCVLVDNGLDVTLTQDSMVVSGPSPPGP